MRAVIAVVTLLGTPARDEKPRRSGAFASGPYWARTSDLRLVEPALSQLS
jgi:hypothetical protein